MTASELALQLHARKHSGYYMLSCPVHGQGGRDRNPSLSIQEHRGRVRLHCFAGCDTRLILAALGLTFRDLGYASEPGWRQRIKPPTVRLQSHRKALGKLEAVYPYHSSDGSLIAQKLRFPGKVFLWRKPASPGSESWVWRVDRNLLPLYRLPELMAARTCILTEGEKDVHSLLAKVKPGTAVTTAPNGAKSWRSSFAQWFTGKTVWIIPDSDAPGMEYAVTAQRDMTPHAKSVRVVSVAPAKDVSDYLLAHSVAELSALMRGHHEIRHNA